MLEPRQYLEKIESLRMECTGHNRARNANLKADLNQKEINSREFASANLRQLLPSIPMEKHERIIDDINFNRACAELDEDNFFLLESTKINDPDSVLESARNKPVIFCTFHFGSYRIISPLLIRHGFNFILPVEGKIFADQKISFMEGSNKCQAYFHSVSQFMVVNAEEPTAALAMARKARAGWSLLAYIDGNTGVQGSSRRDDKLLTTTLLGKTIYARKGIAFLSHFLKLPIVPVICEMTGSMQRTITFHEKIRLPDPAETRDAYCQRATEDLYSVLGSYLQKAPAQWLGWLDMHKYLELDDSSDTEDNTIKVVGSDMLMEDPVDHRLMLNHQRFGFIHQDGQRILLDKETYKLLSIPENITEILETYREPVKVVASGHTQDDLYKIKQLVSMGMLSVVG